MAMGLQDLVMFRDNLQQPEMSGMDNLRNLQALTMQSMGSQEYMNQPMMNTGLMSMPVAQAGFGGFIKSITRIPKKIVKAVKRVAKSPLGKLAITAAPAIFGGGLPMVFANPALNAAFYSGVTSLATGEDPEDALKSAVLSGGLTGLTQGFKTPEGSKGLFSGKDVLSQQGIAEAAKTGAGSYSQVGQAQLAQGGLQPQYATDFSGLATAPSVGSVGATSAPEMFTNYKDFGMQTKPQPEFPVGDVVADQAALESAQSTGIIDTIKDVGGSAIGKAREAIKAGYDKFDALSPGKKALVGGGALLGLGALGSGQEIQAMSQYTPRQLSDADVGFDQTNAFYFDTITKKPLTISEALSRMQTAAQSFGKSGQQQASNVSLGFEKVDPVLSASGGLIGMSYGGQMPMNNMDVKYKEFSGMVGGEGTGMEDNVYMPIVEGEQGQQVATLAVSPKEYVVDANTMSLLGNGNPDEGAEIMDETVKDIRMAATGQKKQQKEIDGLAALNRMRSV